jgi:hypothetical protein
MIYYEEFRRGPVSRGMGEAAQCLPPSHLPCISRAPPSSAFTIF